MTRRLLPMLIALTIALFSTNPMSAALAPNPPAISSTATVPIQAEVNQAFRVSPTMFIKNVGQDTTRRSSETQTSAPLPDHPAENPDVPGASSFLTTNMVTTSPKPAESPNFTGPQVDTSVRSLSTVLFADNFDDGNANGWVTSGLGTWYVENGEYVVDMGSGYDRRGWSLAGDTAWTDYTYELDIRGDAGVDKHIHARYMDSNNFYSVDLRSQWAGRMSVFLMKAQNGTGTHLVGEFDVPYPNYNGVWYHIKMVLQGARILVYVDGTLLIDYTDVGTTVTHGKIGLSGWTGSMGADKVRFDNILVTGAALVYSITGHVTDAASQPLAGVTVSAGAGNSATTDGNGNYTIGGLAAGTYTLTPSKSGYSFFPRTVSVLSDVTGQDFIGTSCIAPSGLNVCELQAGDILLKTGPTFGSCGSLYRAIFSLGGTYFTHSALYLGQVAAPGGSPDDIRPRIAEAQGPSANTADEVWETWLADTQFWDYDDNCVTDWVVVRPSTTSDAIQGAIAYARQKAAASDVVFDLTAFKNDPKRFYCSKLVWKSYLDGSPGGPNLEADRGLGSITFGTQYVTPDDLYYSSPVVQEKSISPGQKTRRGFFYIWSPGHLTLIDPLGRRTGYDPATGDALNEIPEAAYFAPPDVMAETITAPGIGSDWQLVVTGFDTGTYGLESGYADQRTRRDLLLGSTYPGKIETYPVADPIYAMFLPMVLRSP